MLDLVDLGYKRDAFVTSLSRGMTQRLGLARVLFHDPKVLLLDEPASGLDPRASIEIRGLLEELRKLGKTIMVSSHILPELADICNKVGIIEQGVMLSSTDGAGIDETIRQRKVLDGRRRPPRGGRASSWNRVRWSRRSRSRTAGLLSPWPKRPPTTASCPLCWSPPASNSPCSARKRSIWKPPSWPSRKG